MFCIQYDFFLKDISRLYSTFKTELHCKIKNEKLDTWVRAEDQLVLVILTHNTKHVILRISSIPFEVFQIHTQPVGFTWGQPLNLVISEPILAAPITESMFVVAPVKVEIYRPVLPLLEHCPPATGCCRVTKHIKGWQIVRFDCVYTVSSFTRFVDFSAVSLVSCRGKKINAHEKHTGNYKIGRVIYWNMPNSRLASSWPLTTNGNTETHLYRARCTSSRRTFFFRKWGRRYLILSSGSVRYTL